VTGAPPRLPAPARILHATADRLVVSGTANLSLQHIAEAADVSKGLIHYHFHDRETLLARVVEWIGAGIVSRERAALSSATPLDAVDLLWQHVSQELERGHVRTLLDLAHEPGALVQGALVEVAHARRTAAAGTVDRLYTILALKPRVPVVLLAEVTIAFLDGLAGDTRLRPANDSRVTFDVFWLALLSLAE
jgi:AcrR family transcriptional regulator